MKTSSMPGEHASSTAHDDIECRIIEGGRLILKEIRGSDEDRFVAGNDGHMQEVQVKALPLELLESILTPERARAFG